MITASFVSPSPHQVRRLHLCSPRLGVHRHFNATGTAGRHGRRWFGPAEQAGLAAVRCASSCRARFAKCEGSSTPKPNRTGPTGTNPWYLRSIIVVPAQFTSTIILTVTRTSGCVTSGVLRSDSKRYTGLRAARRATPARKRNRTMDTC